MGISEETLAVAKKYTNNSISGISGTLAGKNCTIKSITAITGGNRITFEWTADDSTTRTQTMDVMNGTDGTNGEDGKGISSVAVNSSNHLIITYSDGTTSDAGLVEITSAVDSVNGKKGNVTITASDVNAYTKTEVDTALGNKADKATTLVGYGITDAYSKTEVDSALTNKADKATTIAGYGITNAYTKGEVDSALTNKADKATTLAGYGITDAYTKTEADSAITDKINGLDAPDSAVAGKYVTAVNETNGKITVTKETADTAPTSSSTKMVTSGGVKTYVDGAIADLDVSDTAVSGSYVTAVSETDGVISVTREASDSEPTEDSAKMVQSGGVYTDTQNVYKANGVLGAKNLLPNEATSDTFFTVNSDGSITCNITHTSWTHIYLVQNYVLKKGSYIISCGNVLDAGAWFSLKKTSDKSLIANIGNNVTDHASFTLSEDTNVYAYVGIEEGTYDFTAYPMIRLATDTDDTYQPYAKTNQQLTDDMDDAIGLVPKANTYTIESDFIQLTDAANGSAIANSIYGKTVQDGTPTPTNPVEIYNAVANFECVGKNLIKYPYDWTLPRTSAEGTITFTEGEDGKVILNGTSVASILTQYYFAVNNTDIIKRLEPGKSYRLSGCPYGGTNDGYSMRAIFYRENTSLAIRDVGDGATFTMPDDVTKVNIMIDVNFSQSTTTQTFTNVEFSPMLTLVDADQTYEQYESESVTTDIALRAMEVTSTDDYNLEYGGKYYIADTLDWNDNERCYYLTQRIGVTKASSLTWTSFSNTINSVYTTMLNNVIKRIANAPSVYTKYFNALLYTSSSEIVDDSVYKVNNLNISSSTVITGSTTDEKTEAFNTWLASNDFELQYALISPIRSKLSQSKTLQLLNMRTYDVCSTICGTDAVAPIIGLEYAKERIPALGLTGHNGEAKADMKVDWESNSILGAKNLLRYPYYSTTMTVSGVTITDNGDGTLTLDGTATGRIAYDMTATATYNLLEIGETYLIGFETSDDTIDSSSWALRIHCKKNNSTVLSATDSRGSDVAFTIPEETVGANVQFIIVSGTVLNSVVIKPMIRLASDTDSTYQPYAMTNRELTEDVIALNKLFGMKTFASYTEPADTSLTRNGMLDKALTNFLNNVVKGVEDNERILVTGITLAGSAAMSVTINSLQGNTTTSLSYRVSHKDVGTTSGSLYSNEHCGLVKNSGSALYRIETTTSGVTFIDYGSQTATAANNVVIYYFALKRNG